MSKSQMPRTSHANRNLKLRIELIPSSTWRQTLRTLLPKSQWNKLRQPVLDAQNHSCIVCGGSERLSCHEVWEFDDAARVQRLVRLEAVCGMCHHASHFGRAQQLAAEGYLDLNAVITHFLKVNAVSRAVFGQHKTDAFRLWRERCKRPWVVDFGPWAHLLSPQSVPQSCAPIPAAPAEPQKAQRRKLKPASTAKPRSKPQPKSQAKKPSAAKRSPKARKRSG
jgi:hypothetical protein